MYYICVIEFIGSVLRTKRVCAPNFQISSSSRGRDELNVFRDSIKE